jgi:hypothetical protein
LIPSLFGTAAKLGLAVCVTLVVIAAWSFDQSPAMALLLATFSFCG